MHNTLLITGGAGFIGSNFIRQWLKVPGRRVINLDLLTYAGNLSNLDGLSDPPHTFVKGSINDRELIRRLLRDHRPDAVVHFAAESHVDRSISGPEAFLETNILGTFCLLDEARNYWNSLQADAKAHFRFLHISTDEVYGSLDPADRPFDEEHVYAPNSPYSASKAGSDHLVRAYQHTYGLPTLTTNCSNNYGPYQFPEKLIPLTILHALERKPIPVYGDGRNVRDWLYVEDHCSAIEAVLARGRVGETYNIGGSSELENVSVVQTICDALDEQDQGHASLASRRCELITFVKDRPGHDRRYAIDAGKITRELHWTPRETFETGIRKTVAWYLEHRSWCANVTSGAYKDWMDRQYSYPK